MALLHGKVKMGEISGYCMDFYTINLLLTQEV